MSSVSRSTPGTSLQHCAAYFGVAVCVPLMIGYIQKKISIESSLSLNQSSIDLTDSKFNLTERARRGLLRPLIGRHKELSQIIQTLLLVDKPNPLLVGNPGVGKTALVEGLAQKIVSGDVPERLRNCTIIQLTSSDFIEGTSYRGQFEARVLKTVAAVKKMRNVIIFIDEAHAMMSVGSDREGEGNNLINMLKPHLADGSFRMIGCTTQNEVGAIERDPAMKRRFRQILIEEPSSEDIEVMLRSKIRLYEQLHNCTYSEEAFKEVLSARRSLPGFSPDNMLSILDQLGAEVEAKVEIKSLPAVAVPHKISPRFLGLGKNGWAKICTATRLGIISGMAIRMFIAYRQSIKEINDYDYVCNSEGPQFNELKKIPKEMLYSAVLGLSTCCVESLLYRLFPDKEKPQENDKKPREVTREAAIRMIQEAKVAGRNSSQSLYL